MKELIPAEVIERKIFLIRGQKVMLSNHLAGLYGVTTSALMQAVKRNIDRFPDDFMFSLSRDEIMNLSQFVISSKMKHAPMQIAATRLGALRSQIVTLNNTRGISSIMWPPQPTRLRTGWINFLVLLI